MQFQFKKHYTKDEAQALLPQIRLWLKQLSALRTEMEALDKRLSQQLGSGYDVGGRAVHDWVKTLASTRRVLAEFQAREIQVKDLDRGLIDFPAIIGGREVFLCWEQDEESVEYWHDLDSGYAGREPLE